MTINNNSNNKIVYGSIQRKKRAGPILSHRNNNINDCGNNDNNNNENNSNDNNSSNDNNTHICNVQILNNFS